MEALFQKRLIKNQLQSRFNLRHLRSHFLFSPCQHHRHCHLSPCQHHRLCHPPDLLVIIISKKLHLFGFLVRGQRKGTGFRESTTLIKIKEAFVSRGVGDLRYRRRKNGVKGAIPQRKVKAMKKRRNSGKERRFSLKSQIFWKKKITLGQDRR